MCYYGPVHKGANHVPESHFGSWFWPFPDLKAWFYPLWMQSSFKSGFWNAKKEVSVLDRDPPRKPDSEDLWTQSSFGTWFASFVNWPITSQCADPVHDQDGGCKLVNARSSNYEPNQEADRDSKQLSKHDSLLCEQALWFTCCSHGSVDLPMHSGVCLELDGCPKVSQLDMAIRWQEDVGTWKTKDKTENYFQWFDEHYTRISLMETHIDI